MSDKTNPRIYREAIGYGEGFIAINYTSETFRAFNLAGVKSVSRAMHAKALADAKKLGETAGQGVRVRHRRKVQAVIRGNAEGVCILFWHAVELKALTNDAVHEAYAAAKLD